MTLSDELPFSVRREVVIRAPRATVFAFFTDPVRFARWWGEGSTVDARRGGALKIVYPGGSTASGELLELVPDQRVAFSFGYDRGTPIAPGASRVTVTVADHPRGTLLTLVHDVADDTTRGQHEQGWRYQLALFANVAADEAQREAASTADRWFAAWNEDDSVARRAALAALLTREAEFHDAFACTRGTDDLVAHVAAARQHMPGIVIARSGTPRHCQGTLLVDWSAQGPDGKVVGRGTNVFELAPDGRIARATGFAAP